MQGQQERGASIRVGWGSGLGDQFINMKGIELDYLFLLIDIPVEDVPIDIFSLQAGTGCCLDGKAAAKTDVLLSVEVVIMDVDDGIFCGEMYSPDLPVGYSVFDV